MTDIDRKNINISPAYLMAISNSVDALNHFYEQENLGVLSGEYKATLANSFKNLGENLQIYSLSQVDNRMMIQSSVLKCKSEL